jgi:hypothetical protein
MSLRKTQGLLFALALLLPASGANAALLSSVTWNQTVNVLGTQITIPIAAATGTGASTADSFKVLLSIATPVQTHFAVPAAVPPVSVLLTFGPGQQAVSGTYMNMTTNTAIANRSINGRLRVWLGTGVIPSNLSTIPPNPVADQPLFVGFPFALTTTFTVFGATNTLFLNGPGWSFGPYVITPTNNFNPLPGTPMSATTGSFNLTSTGTTTKGAGMLSLVSPSVSVVRGLANSTSLSFGRVTLNFAPEPSAPLLLGSGIAALALLARRRLR